MKIIAAVDRSRISDAVVDMAINVARSDEAEVVLVSVAPLAGVAQVPDADPVAEADGAWEQPGRQSPRASFFRGRTRCAT